MVGIHWNTSLFLGWPIFRGYANFREGIVMFPLKALNICFLRKKSRFDYTAHLTLFAASPCQTFPFVLFCTTISIYFLWWPISYMNLPKATHTKGDLFGDSSSSSNFSSRGTKIFKSEDQILSKEPGNLDFEGLLNTIILYESLTKAIFFLGGVWVFVWTNDWTQKCGEVHRLRKSWESLRRDCNEEANSNVTHLQVILFFFGASGANRFFWALTITVVSCLLDVESNKSSWQNRDLLQILDSLPKEVWKGRPYNTILPPASISLQLWPLEIQMLQNLQQALWCCRGWNILGAHQKGKRQTSSSLTIMPWWWHVWSYA